MAKSQTGASALMDARPARKAVAKAEAQTAGTGDSCEAKRLVTTGFKISSQRRVNRGSAAGTCNPPRLMRSEIRSQSIRLAKAHRTDPKTDFDQIKRPEPSSRALRLEPLCYS